MKYSVVKRYKKEGKCIACGKPSIDKLYCQKHRDMRRAREKRLYDEAKAKGLCIKCKHRKALKGYKRCGRCVSAMKKYHANYYKRNVHKVYIDVKKKRERYKKEGLCILCGKPLLKDIETGIKCITCLEREM